MTITKELGKYEVVPTLEQLMAVVEYYEDNATSSGRINFTQKQMLESPIISKHFKSPTYLQGINTYLSNEGFISKVEIGNAKRNSVWDVSKLINKYDEVLTREKIGKIYPSREEETGELVVPKDHVEIEIVRNVDRAPKEEAPVVKTHTQEVVQSSNKDNNTIMTELNSAINDMMGYLQNLPVEMNGHLRSISNQLQLTDETAMTKLQADYEKLQEKYGNLQVSHDNIVNHLSAEKKDLEDEVQRLVTELEEVSGKANYNTNQIVRQRNNIMDEVDRMCNAPAWTIKQNKVNYRNSIETKLEAIMNEIGIDKE
jgi:hypothetical protein